MKSSGSEEERAWGQSRKAAWRKGHQGLVEAQVGFQSIRMTVGKVNSAEGKKP